MVGSASFVELDLVGAWRPALCRVCHRIQ